MSIVVIYIIGIVITWICAGFQTGRQFAILVKNNPAAPIQVNWGNVFFQGCVWPAFWASNIGKCVEDRKTTLRLVGKD